MSAPLRVLITTDSFPPRCGGSGWSTWELARGLTGLGHHVEVLKIEVGSPPGRSDSIYETIPVTTVRVNAPALPVVRNLVKNEMLWRDLAAYLTDERLPQGRFDILHAQHVMTTVPTIRAARATDTPVVATIRDYWPVCYWSDLIYDPAQPRLCPECSAHMMTRCVRPRAGALPAAAWPLIPYMMANLRTKRRTLAGATAIVAVSSTLADDLRARAPEIAATPIFTIPSPVDMGMLDTGDAVPLPIPGPYVLYAGKLATNKGVQFLVPALADAGIRWPLVVAGDGPLRTTIERDAAARGVSLHVLGWIDRPAVLTWMRHAALLAFPSYGPESLSRVLIEAAAIGVPIAAMNTGGTRDILRHRATALLSDDPAGFTRDLSELAHDERLRHALAHAARADVRSRFAAASVVRQIEAVYRQLVSPEAA
jgi:glycosyltransferase involved in cell wall biosynthesis